MSSAVAKALQAATAAVSFAAMRERSKFGIAIAAIIAMMATTIISSISVNPLLFMTLPPKMECRYLARKDMHKEMHNVPFRRGQYTSKLTISSFLKGIKHYNAEMLAQGNV